MPEKINMLQFLKNLNNEEKLSPERYIFRNRNVFEYFWREYRQIFNFNADYKDVKNVCDKYFNGMRGIDFYEKLKSLPYNTFIINCKNSKGYNLQPFFYEESDRNKRIFEDCKDDLLLISYIQLNKMLYLFISPTDYNGNVKKNSIVLKIFMYKGVTKSIERLRKVRKPKPFLYINIITFVIKHIIYLSKCDKVELVENIKYIINENNETTFNIVTDNKEIKPIRERDFVIAHKIIDGVLYYHKSVTEPTGKTLCSHTRRGHQHRYWVGSGDKKRLVTKWVEPIIVNEGKNELSTVINNIN